jgi:hypothetical protein
MMELIKAGLSTHQVIKKLSSSMTRLCQSPIIPSGEFSADVVQAIQEKYS